MRRDPVARVYAQALLDVGRDQNRMDALGAQLEQVAAGVYAEPNLCTFLESPVVDAQAKKRALVALRGKLDDALVNFLCLLVDKNRIGALDSIAGAYRDLADAAAGRVRVRALTAVTLPDDLRERLVTTVTATLKQECVLETAVQEDLLGGLVIEVGDKVYDGSVRRALRRMQSQMTRSSGL
jgi:F-type H+-transporting ATPase subunit delta